MRLNENVAIITNKLILVPYEESHVLEYSEWMSSEALREATRSDRLTLSQEYAMQKAWREDADKLTFILCLPSERLQEALTQGSEDTSVRPEYTVIEGSDDTNGNLIGDVNLFLCEDGDDLEEDDERKEVAGEIEVMIAKMEYQGQGLGKVAVLVFILYVLRHREQILAEGNSDWLTAKEKRLKHLRVKIGKDNTGSLMLFQKLGFKKIKEEPNVFDEFELRLSIEPQSEVEARLERMLNECGVNQLVEGGFQNMEVSEEI
ncbi:hypothetical protein TWF696_002548 [Orbilia brochopaga]|uniref:N-acetyltransferase domain-containing protein n=1 Tax=Orbilia brochopaga TaxID=3140254 RepID=A0AAV9U318_9PEZI